MSVLIGKVKLRKIGSFYTTNIYNLNNFKSELMLKIKLICLSCKTKTENYITEESYSKNLLKDFWCSHCCRLCKIIY
jgi:hypothetical protein